MTTIKVKENEPFEVAMRRFKRTIEKSGLLTELRAREFYEKPTAERKRKLAAAVKRTYKRLRSQLLPPKLYWPIVNIIFVLLRADVNEDGFSKESTC